MKTRSLMGIGLGAMAILLLVWYVEASVPRTSVTEQHSGFNAGRFLILLFPTEENAVCGRAVLVGLDEYERDTIDVYRDGGVMAMAKERFTAAPPGEYLTLVERLNAELAVWGEETDWKRTEWDFKLGAQGIAATLRVEDKRGTVRQYTYLISDTSVHPVSMRTIVDMAKKMAS